MKEQISFKKFIFGILLSGVSYLFLFSPVNVSAITIISCGSTCNTAGGCLCPNTCGGGSVGVGGTCPVSTGSCPGSQGCPCGSIPDGGSEYGGCGAPTCGPLGRVLRTCDSGSLTTQCVSGSCSIITPPPPGPPPPPGTPPPPPPGWGACGSCSSCPPFGGSSQCVRSPDGSCLWDPGTCSGGGGGACSLEWQSWPAVITLGTPVQMQVFARGALSDWQIHWGWNNGSSSTGTFNPATTVGPTSNISFTPTSTGNSVLRVYVEDGDWRTNDVLCETTRAITVYPPLCTASAPVAPVLVSPATGNTIPNNSASLTWNSNAGEWGAACPVNNNQYKVFLSKSCTGVYTQYNGYDLVSGNTYAKNISNLDWGSTYCWYVQKDNGSLQANSPVWSFRVNSTPVVTSSAFTHADTCYTSAASGRWTNPNTENPITFTVTYQDVEGDTFSDASIALIQNTSVVNGLIVDATTVAQAAHNSNSIAAIIWNSGAVGTYAGVAGWQPGVMSGDQVNTANTATMIGAGVDTKIVRNGTTATVTYKIRFENTFPTATYNIYSMMRMQNSDGSYVSSDQTTTGSAAYRRISSWTIDTVNPGVTITGPTYNSATKTFNVTYGATDNLGVQDVANYITRSDPTGALRDNTIGQNLGFTYSPNVHSGSVNTSNYLTQPTRNYTDNSVNPENVFTFQFDATDRGCNTVSTNFNVSKPSPWLITYQGIASANQGYSISIPDNSTYTVPFSSDTGTPYLSTYGVIAGDNKIPSLRVSKTQNYVTSYNNEAIVPPSTSDFTNWYDHLLDTVKRNNSTNTGYWQLTYVHPGPTPNVAGRSTNKSIADWLVIPQNSKLIYFMTGDLDFLAGTICDVRTIIFVSGKVRISPDVTVTGDNGCIIVAKGDIEILPGTTKPAVALGSATPPNYNVINFYMFTDGKFITYTDNAPGVANKYEGLYINGGLNARTLQLNRDMNYGINTTDPGIVIKYDPRYLMLFGSDLGHRTYSLREQL